MNNLPKLNYILKHNSEFCKNENVRGVSKLTSANVNKMCLINSMLLWSNKLIATRACLKCGNEIKYVHLSVTAHQIGLEYAPIV
jgi:hypothetical protein